MIVTIVACLWSAQSGKYCVSSNVSRRVYGDKKSIVTPQGLATIPASHARVMLLGNCNVARGRGPGQRKVSSGKRGEFSGDFRGVSWTLFGVYPPAKSRAKTNLLQCISGHKRTNVPIVARGGSKRHARWAFNGVIDSDRLIGPRTSRPLWAPMGSPLRASLRIRVPGRSSKRYAPERGT